MSSAIYFAGEGRPDPAIERGLSAVDCRVRYTRTITDTLLALREQHNTLQAVIRARGAMIGDMKRFLSANAIVLIASVQASALTMLNVLKVENVSLPPTLLVDQLGTDIRAPLQAIQLGVRDYLLPTDSDIDREMRTRKLVEDARRETTRVIQKREPPPPPPIRYTSPLSPPELRWDSDTQTIFIGDRDVVKLSPVEARTFDLLYTRRGQAVSMDELIQITQKGENPNVSLNRQIQLLRTHLARLRRRLESNPNFGYRIENVRGSGYVML
jgi:DNA-binding response OmpR family regulator